MRVLAIDLGTSGVKTAVVDETGRTVADASRPLTTIHPGDGAAVQDAEVWWTVIGSCARATVAASGGPAEIGAVAVTSQYMSTVAVDDRGQPLSPVVMWMDHRGRAFHPVLENWDAIFTWLDRHGLPPMSNDGIAHIALLRSLDPGLIDRGARFVEPVDAVVARMTGRVAATQSSALGLMLVDNRTHGALGYDPDLLRLAEIDEAWLPTLVPMDAPVGELLPDAADHLGLTAGTVVLPGTIDSITSAMGTGAIGPQTSSLVIGTTSVIVSHVPSKQSDLDHAITAIPSPVDGQYFVMAENGVGGRALDHVLRSFVYAADDLALGPMPADAFERAERVAASARPGAGGTMFLPWLVGTMSPTPDDEIRAAFVNLGLTTGRAELLRAVYEGVAANVAWLLPAVGDFTGHRPTSLCFGGGAARSDLWSQVLADTTGVPVHQLADAANTNTRGAALLALVQLGRLSWADTPALLERRRTYEPDPADATAAAERVARLVEYHGLTRTFHRALPHP